MKNQVELLLYIASELYLWFILRCYDELYAFLHGCWIIVWTSFCSNIL